MTTRSSDHGDCVLNCALSSRSGFEVDSTVLDGKRAAVIASTGDATGSPVVETKISSRKGAMTRTADAVSHQLVGSVSAVTQPTQIPAVSANITRPLHVTGSSSLTWQQLKWLPMQSPPPATNHKEPTALGEGPAATATEVTRSPTIDASPAAMPLTPIPPPPPLAQHPKRSSRKAPRQRRRRSRAGVSITTKQRGQFSRLGQERLREQEDSATTQSVAMPSSTDAQRSSSRTRAPRSHPHVTRRRSKGKGAAARRKEKRRVAKATVMSPVYSFTLRPQAQPFVPRSYLLSHIWAIMQAVQWIQHMGFLWLPWDVMDWSLPYFY